MTCATHSGKKIIIIGTKKMLLFLDPERLLLQDAQDSKGSRWYIDLDAHLIAIRGA
jgi:hypothetical protein